MLIRGISEGAATGQRKKKNSSSYPVSRRRSYFSSLLHSEQPPIRLVTAHGCPLSCCLHYGNTSDGKYETRIQYRRARNLGAEEKKCREYEDDEPSLGSAMAWLHPYYRGKGILSLAQIPRTAWELHLRTSALTCKDADGLVMLRDEYARNDF